MNTNENNITFLINKNTIINNYKNYRKIGTIYYPLKTNTNRIILETLENNFNFDDGFLISNLNHFKILSEMGINPKKMCLINVLSENSTIKYLYNSGVRFFVFDNINILQEFISYADLFECKISIRLNTMEVFDDTLMHLGSSTEECKKMLKLLDGKCNDVGISFYLQTKIKNEIGALEKMLYYIENNFKDYGIDFLSLAGIKRYDELNVKFINKVKESMNLNEIILEPGKYLISDAINIITKVIRLKKINEKNILIIKNGIYSGLLDVLLYNEQFKFYFIHNDEYIDFTYEKDSKHNVEVYICGGSSDSGDIIGTMYINEKYFKEIKVGSEILIKDVGAYFEEFFMSYGGDINKVFMEVDE